MKIAFIAHCGLEENAGVHISTVASHLAGRGHECRILLPEDPPPGLITPAGLSVHRFDVFMENANDWNCAAGTDVIHAWTPREHVRKMAMAFQRATVAPIIVHMEDNEETLVSSFAGRRFQELLDMPQDSLRAVIPPNLAHPRNYRNFLARADGFTSLIERLFEFKPLGIPGALFWPGYWEPLAEPCVRTAELRAKYGMTEDKIVILYTGNVHASNLEEIQSLFAAIAALRAQDIPLILMKTGRPAPVPGFENADFLIDRGFVPRGELTELLALSDLLIQPGKIGPFNDYRFPSKLPDYLASGRPVILPDTNIGLEMRDGHEVLKLTAGTAQELGEKIGWLLDNPALARQIGEGGRAFALAHLTWGEAVDRLENLYRDVMSRTQAPDRIAERIRA